MFWFTLAPSISGQTVEIFTHRIFFIIIRGESLYIYLLSSTIHLSLLASHDFYTYIAKSPQGDYSKQNPDFCCMIYIDICDSSTFIGTIIMQVCPHTYTNEVLLYM